MKAKINKAYNFILKKIKLDRKSEEKIIKPTLKSELYYNQMVWIDELQKEIDKLG